MIKEEKLKFVDNNQKSITSNIDKNLIRSVVKRAQTLLFFIYSFIILLRTEIHFPSHLICAAQPTNEQQ